MIWYKAKLEDIYVSLRTSRDGIRSRDAKRRLKRYGLNEILVHGDPWWRVIIEPFFNVFVAVLGVAGLVSIMSGEEIEAIIVLVIICINAGIFYIQHYTTSRVLRALQRKRLSKVTVVRDGLQRQIGAEMIVPGDVLLVSEGERIAADARIIEATSLQIDESSLTGESLPIHKTESVFDQDKELYEQHNMVFQGTYVLAGEARVLVVATASTTEFGRIAQLAGKKKDESPLQQKINRMISLIVRTIAVLVVLVFALALYRDIPVHDALRFVLSMSVSAVPEGLPVALSVIFVLGMRRMAKHKVLVRSFKAIEDIGLVTTIATDKTGTLTKNHLTVVESWDVGDQRTRSFASWTLDTQDKLSDPLDIAIEEASSSRPRVDQVYPFDLSLRMSGAYSLHEQQLYVKGSPEHILAKSRLSKDDHHRAESAMHELAAKGYRVIAFAKKTYKTAPQSLADISALDFVGFLAFADELRPEARRAVELAQSAGISVRLITGDHFETAFNVAKTVSIAEHPGQVVQGFDLPKKTSALAIAVKDKRVFARIVPEDKYRILEALKTTDIVAMTGDGVNDVPAIANAHVGIAMGSGSDIARDAGGMILVDDNFSSIVKAISEGRRIYDNVRRMLFYLLSTTIGEVGAMVGALLFGLPLPVTAIQILWINLVTDTAMVLPLGLEPAEKGHMKQPPREPNAPLFKRFMVIRLILAAMTIAVTNLILVAYLHANGYSDTYIQTVILFSIVAAQWVNALNARSEMESLWARLRVRNTPLVIGFVTAIILQSLVLFGPLGAILGTQQVDPYILLGSFMFVGLSVLAVVEAHKLYMRRR